MASFTDRTPQFNPYVQQLPVEAMVKVGMEKQQRYNEGVQKIQTQIDDVAGLGVIRDVDKQYLQSKLNALGDNLKTVAAGDFSNAQLVNSVGGMTSQIAKDPIIRNAVYSAQVVRKGQQDLETAKTAGKSAIQNEDDWNDQVNSWARNGDLKSRFSGSYKPYTDLSEKYSKVAKDIKDTEYSYDQPFQTNSDGSLKYFTTDKKGNTVETTKDKGQPMYDDAMKSITTKGVSAKKILDNFYSNTTENDRQQLAIDAKYHYKNASFDTFKNDIVANYNLSRKQLNEHATELTVALTSTKIPDADKAVMQAKLTDIKAQLADTSVEKDLSSAIDQLKDPRNLERYKVNLYTQKYLSQLAQDKSTETYKEEIKNNPYAQMNMEKKKMQWDVIKENTRINQFNTTHAWDVYKWTEDHKFKIKDEADKAKAKLGGEPVVHEAGKDNDAVPPTASTINDKINANNVSLKELDNSMLTPPPSGKAKYTKQGLDALSDKYNQDPNMDLTDNDLREYLNARRVMEQDNIRKGTLLKAAGEITAPIEKQLTEVFKSQPGVFDGNGKEIFSAQELVIASNQMQSFYETTGGPGSKGVKLNDKALIDKFKGTKYEPLAVAFVKHYYGNPMTQPERVMFERGRDLGIGLAPTVSKLINEKLTAESNYLATKMPEALRTRGTLSKSNKVDMDHVDQLISESTNPDTDVIDTSKKSEFQPEAIMKWRDKESIAKNLDYKLSKNADGSGKLIVAHGTEEYSIPLTPKAFAAYFPRYAEVSPVTAIKEQIMSSPEHTTNPVSAGNAVTAAHTGYEIPLFKDTNMASKIRYDIEGAKRNIGDKSDGYQIRVYVNDGRVWKNKVINQKGYITEDQIEDVVGLIGMDVIQNILKQ